MVQALDRTRLTLRSLQREVMAVEEVVTGDALKASRHAAVPTLSSLGLSSSVLQAHLTDVSGVSRCLFPLHDGTTRAGATLCNFDG